MLQDVGIAVPKITETRCRDGSVQARQGMQRTKQVTPSLHLFCMCMWSTFRLCNDIIRNNVAC